MMSCPYSFLKNWWRSICVKNHCFMLIGAFCKIFNIFFWLCGLSLSFSLTILQFRPLSAFKLIFDCRTSQNLVISSENDSNVLVCLIWSTERCIFGHFTLKISSNFFLFVFIGPLGEVLFQKLSNQKLWCWYFLKSDMILNFQYLQYNLSPFFWCNISKWSIIVQVQHFHYKICGIQLNSLMNIF